MIDRLARPPLAAPPGRQHLLSLIARSQLQSAVSELAGCPQSPLQEAGGFVLTFVDGPHPCTTELLLNALAAMSAGDVLPARLDGGEISWTLPPDCGKWP